MTFNIISKQNIIIHLRISLKNVSKYLKRKKIPHIKVREPGGNKNSEKIRKLILDKKSNFNKNTAITKFQLIFLNLSIFQAEF